MPTILALNPKKKTRKKPAKAKKEVKKMAARKRNKDGRFSKTGRSSGGAKTKTKTIVRYQTKKNPIKKTAKRAASYGRQIFAGVNVGGAFRKTLPLLVGALAAKFAAKKFSDDPATEGSNWTWKNYGLGMLGGFVAAVATKMIFRATAATTENVLAGAMLLMAFKCFVYEVAPSNEYLDSWFSEDDDDYLPDSEIAGYLGEGEGEPGDLYQADDDTYVMGQDHLWRSASEGGRVDQDDDYVQIGDDVAPVDPTLGFGDDVEPVDPTLGYYGNVIDEFQKAYA